MAATYRAQASGGTTAAGADPSCTITPAIGDLFIVAASISNDPDNGELCTCSDNNGGTYTYIGSFIRANVTPLVLFVRTALLSNTTSTTITVAIPDASSNAAVCGVIAVSGMLQAGWGAIRQLAYTLAGASVSSPSVEFAHPLLTTSMTVGFVASGDTTTTAPGSWTERFDANQSTPTTALEAVTRDSGSTATTVTWGATQSTNWSACLIELNDKAAPTWLGDTPDSASEMSTAAGGTWSIGVPLNDASGDFLAQFGSGDLTNGGGSFARQQAGVVDTNSAVTLDGAQTGGTVLESTTAAYNVTTGDLLFAALIRPDNIDDGGCALQIGTYSGGDGWRLSLLVNSSDSAAGTYYGLTFEAQGSSVPSSSVLFYAPIGRWLLVYCVIDRSTDKVRLCVMRDGAQYLGLEGDASGLGTISTGNPLMVDTVFSSCQGDTTIEHLWWGGGSGVATGRSAGLGASAQSLWNRLQTPSYAYRPIGSGVIGSRVIRTPARRSA